MDAPLLLRLRILEDDFEERRDNIQRHIVFNQRENPWALAESRFIRLNKELARQLIASLEPRLPRVTRESVIPTDIKVLVALRFLATGCYQMNVAQDKVLNVSQPSVSVCISQVCDAMEGILGQWIIFPQTEEEMQRIKQRFLMLTSIYYLFGHDSQVVLMTLMCGNDLQCGS
uniref:Nuclease HARBI1 n=1 Tax=Timema poppense TaxID=170557 RepID=A0A7R9DRU0_TIMPO|nr:unnamed protein product [Timema poppensis]